MQGLSTVDGQRTAYSGQNFKLIHDPGWASELTFRRCKGDGRPKLSRPEFCRFRQTKGIAWPIIAPHAAFIGD
jgi:hypothetical protein